MPFTPDEFDGLMNELNQPELDLSRKTEILQSLRKDYSGVLENTEKSSKTIEELTKEREQLLLTNSKLFRSSSYFSSDDQKQQNEKEKTFSETIRLSDIEKREV